MMKMADGARAFFRDVLQKYPGEYEVIDVLEEQANRLLQGHRERDDAVFPHIVCWHPRLVGAPLDQILLAEFTLEDAKLAMAREHGFADWAEVEREGRVRFDAQFEEAVDAITDGELDRLEPLLRENPALVRMTSPYAHRATLLHYVAANGVETWRQKVPPNAVAVTQALLNAGADVEAKANMYGGGCTTMELLVTSSHPHEAGLTGAMAEVLRSAGQAG